MCHARLQASLDEAREESRSLQSKLQELTQSMRIKEAELQNDAAIAKVQSESAQVQQRARADALETENERLRDQLKSNSKATASGDTVSAAVSNQLVELTAKCAVVEEQKQSLQRQYDQQIKHADQLKQTVEELRTKLTEEQLACSDHRHAAEVSSTELAKVTASLKEVQEKAAKVDGSQLVASSEKVEVYKEQLAEVRADLKAKQAELNARTDELMASQLRGKELELQVREASSGKTVEDSERIIQLSNDNSERIIKLSNEIFELKTKLNSAEQQVARLEAEIAVVTSERDGLQSQV
eukprot:SAG31_NODE_8988_length_1352_cov_1.447725_1_plen_297_part_10